jgi:MoaA/NifB/PqqE/SkfB family radical SAM enzyme
MVRNNFVYVRREREGYWMQFYVYMYLYWEVTFTCEQNCKYCSSVEL